MGNVLLFKASNELSACCRQSHTVHRFNVPTGAERLIVRFSYAPKRASDVPRGKRLIEAAVRKYEEPDDYERLLERYTIDTLQNLLTVSIDDPAGFRGAAHRPSPEQTIVLGESGASPGFIAGTIRSGFWEVTVSVHEIVTSTCMYRLAVEAEGLGEDRT
ncbi:hypothetical protein [Paenibacillus alkalitolerans]|uniref:hypothetical protein n=1 Tax=Paenibacillus alkalitolerans TaxID=2799335 RepID=UPI0018F67779|nr:hypothetical protein [Paenibacillus alkalitolerans]